MATMRYLLDSDHHDTDNMDKSSSSAVTNAPTHTYVHDACAMAATPANVKDSRVPMSSSSGDIKVQIKDGNILVVSGEQRQEEEGGEGGGRVVRMERRVGKFMRQFVLPENANTDAMKVVTQDGVLTVTIYKVLPPEPKTIDVQIA